MSKIRMDWVRTSVAAVATAVLVSGALFAAPPSTDIHPGYLPIEQLGFAPGTEASVEVNLTSSLLKMVSSFVASEEPEFGELISGLEGVHVRVFELADDQSKEAAARVRTASSWLVDHGWEVIIKVLEDDEQVYIYSRTVEDKFVGLSVLAVDDVELTVVNLVGMIDLGQLGRVAAALDLPVSIPELSAMQQGRSDDGKKENDQKSDDQREDG